MVADPLSRYDCVPVIAGAQAIVVGRRDQAPKARPAVRVRAIRHSFNYDTSRAMACRPASARSRTSCGATAGVKPADIDVASIYDDYPTMVLAQLNDLGMIPSNDMATFCRTVIAERRLPINTWGGMLSAGQPGGHAGGMNGISEAVLQLQGRAGRAAGEGRRACGRHRLRHDDVPLRRHGGCGGSGARVNERGRDHLALRDMPDRGFPRAAALSALPRPSIHDGPRHRRRGRGDFGHPPHARPGELAAAAHRQRAHVRRPAA